MLEVNSKKPKTPDEPKVKCETCEDYKNYMMVDPDVLFCKLNYAPFCKLYGTDFGAIS